MSFVLHLHSYAPLYYNQSKGYNLNFHHKGYSKLGHRFVDGKISGDMLDCMNKKIRSSNLHVGVNHMRREFSERKCSMSESASITDWYDLDDELIGTPWEGAIMYKRNPRITHLEYCTTLERLGLEKFSSDVSKSRASIMGLRVTKDVKDYPLGTPVQISVDVTRRRKKLKLDGIIKTVLAMSCSRCAQPAPECIFTEFSLLLCEEPIKEPDVIDMGVVFGANPFDTPGSVSDSENEDDEEALIDLDDWLHFPPEDKEIDISKNIRDIIHLEITHDTVCSASCRGLCFKCGTDLNISSCDCEKEEGEEIGLSPFRKLKEQLLKK